MSIQLRRLCLLTLLSIASLLGYNVADAAPVTKSRVKLVVLDARTKEPIISAVVRSNDLKSPVLTGMDGDCQLVFTRPVSKTKLMITFVGYKPIEQVVTFDKSDKVTLFMHEDSELMDEVLVTSQKRHTSVLQQAISIDSETLEKSSSLSLAKMLESVPGVSSISSGGTIAKPVIQGMHSSRILLMNNGVRLESQSWGSDHAPEIDHTGASVVEVVKGAESIKYGYGAMGGVVLFNQAELPFGREKFTVNGRANLGYDSNAHGYSGAGSVEMGYKIFGLRLHGMYQRAGDYSTPEYILNNTGYNNISLSALGGVKWRSITATIFTSLYYSRSGIYFGSKISDLAQLLERFKIGRPDPITLKPFTYNIEPPFQQTQHFTLKGDVKWQINDRHKLTFIGSYQDNLRWEFENRKIKDLSWYPVQDLLLSTYRGDLMWNADWGLWDMKTEVGATGTYQYNYNYPGTKQPAFIPNYAALTVGGYVLHSGKVGPLQLSAGLRYDFRAMDVDGYTSIGGSPKYYTDWKIFSNYTMSFAAHYQFNDQLDARANIGWSWRPPDINELYSIGLHHGTYWVEGNRNLKSENGYKAVLGMRWRNSWISIEPSAFYQGVKNYIYDSIGKGMDRFYNHPTGKYPKFKFGQDDARLFGGDLMATVSPIEGLSLSARGEWINARNLTQNEYLPFMPSDRYGASASYEWKMGSDKQYHFLTSLSGIFVTKQMHFNPEKDLVDETPPAYALMNATAEFTWDLPANREFKLILIGDNILNTMYKEYTDRFRYYAHGKGANISLRTIIKF